MTPARFGQICGSLSFLLKLTQASDGNKGDHNSTPTVVVLVLVFLFLLAMLIVAWRHLNRVTEGKYHPRQLCSGHDSEEERAGLAGRLMGTWQTFHSWVTRGASEEQEQLRDDGERMEMQQHEEAVQNGEDMRSQQSTGQCSQQDTDDGHKGSSSDGINSEDDYSSLGGQDLRGKAEAQGPEETEEEPPAGSSEALLCDLHAFSGSASWQDERSQRAGKLHITAL